MIHYVLFNSIHDVLKAEKMLKEKSIDGEVVPVPRILSSDCGVCIKSAADGETLETLFSVIKGVRCFSYDGADYRPGCSKNGEA